MEETPQTPNPNETIDNASRQDIQNALVEDVLEYRSKEIAEAFRFVAAVFKNTCKRIVCRLCIWIFLCLLLMSGIAYFYFWIFNFTYPDEWSLDLGYKTAARITSLAALFSLLTFCIKMMRSYLHMYENNKDKQTIIRSSSKLVSAANSPKQREVIYLKMIELIVEKEKTGIISEEIKDFGSLNNFVNAVKKEE